ncbi:hypothetical protein DBT_1757 [Dissulfuribacter thermophilus]|uniref:Uncharacterized protein n=1 Tax=Dissulfuribacter thermophilus TaxID=1156395 RepID=A0A1B9F4W4_9BACT|nr:hypothetical protein [Dissulfuribacter thermophilus]OCC14962.1 hypothetical protein DBT_1757 [Dissulfuribacter thermophilus]
MRNCFRKKTARKAVILTNKAGRCSRLPSEMEMVHEDLSCSRVMTWRRVISPNKKVRNPMRQSLRRRRMMIDEPIAIRRIMMEIILMKSIMTSSYKEPLIEK